MNEYHTNMQIILVTASIRPTAQPISIHAKENARFQGLEAVLIGNGEGIIGVRTADRVRVRKANSPHPPAQAHVVERDRRS